MQILVTSCRFDNKPIILSIFKVFDFLYSINNKECIINGRFIRRHSYFKQRPCCRFSVKNSRTKFLLFNYLLFYQWPSKEVLKSGRMTKYRFSLLNVLVYKTFGKMPLEKLHIWKVSFGTRKVALGKTRQLRDN